MLEHVLEQMPEHVLEQMLEDMARERGIRHCAPTKPPRARASTRPRPAACCSAETRKPERLGNSAISSSKKVLARRAEHGADCLAMLQAASESEVPRRVPGRPWAKGQSGNPKGRRGERKFNGKTLAELAREMTHEALEAVRQVLHMPDVPPALRLQAADIVLRRGWGDAPRTPEVVDNDRVFIVQQLAVEAKPTAGVIASPVRQHIALTSIPRADVLDIEPAGDGKPHPETAQ